MWLPPPSWPGQPPQADVRLNQPSCPGAGTPGEWSNSGDPNCKHLLSPPTRAAPERRRPQTLFLSGAFLLPPRAPGTFSGDEVPGAFFFWFGHSPRWARVGTVCRLPRALGRTGNHVGRFPCRPASGCGGYVANQASRRQFVPGRMHLGCRLGIEDRLSALFQESTQTQRLAPENHGEGSRRTAAGQNIAGREPVLKFNSKGGGPETKDDRDHDGAALHVRLLHCEVRRGGRVAH